MRIRSYGSVTLCREKMTRLFVSALIALVICIAIKSQAESLEDAERPPNQKDDNEISEGDDIDRSALAYASVTRQRPMPMKALPIKFVNCFACVDCPLALANTTAKYCPYTNDPSKTNKCVVYAEQYIQLKKLWYVRGCASERGSCAEIRRGHENTPSVKLSFCSECEGDRCNGVSRSSSDITTALLVLVLCPVLGKYTVS